MILQGGIDAALRVHVSYELGLTHPFVLMQMNSLSLLVLAAMVASASAYAYAHDGYGTVSR